MTAQRAREKRGPDRSLVAPGDPGQTDRKRMPTRLHKIFFHGVSKMAFIDTPLPRLVLHSNENHMETPTPT